MAETVADFIVNRLSEWGVKRCFGYSGDGINAVMGSLRRAPDSPEFIQVRHEESASFMACAHAKFTGQVGVCVSTAGPGATHLVTGLYDARMDHQPVLALVGQKAQRSLGSGFIQEMDLPSLFKDVSSEYLVTITVPEQAPHAIDRAMRVALDRKTVATVIVPSDVQDLEMPGEIKAQHGGARSSIGYGRPRIIPSEADLDAAAEILNGAERPAILIGAGCRGAGPEVVEFANILNAGLAKALLGKDVLPDDLPWSTGCLGLLGTEPSDYLMQHCDRLVLIGTSFPYTDFLPRKNDVRAVQIDIQGKSQGINYPVELNLTGDAKSTLAALTPRLQQSANTKWREKIAQLNRDWWKKLENRAFKEAKPINPQRIFWELSQRLPDEAILCADSGSSTNWYARDLRVREGMMASLSGKLASMGAALPYAIAAKFAFPERTPFAFVGDGAMQMLGVTNLITISKYWRRWTSPKLVVLVLNNRDLAHVSWEMRAMEGDPKFEASQDIPDVPYAEFARSLGLAGIRLQSPEFIPEVIDEALRSDIPFLIDAVTDPNVPTIPPHISFEQAVNFMSATVDGEADVSSVVRQTARDIAPRLFN